MSMSINGPGRISVSSSDIAAATTAAESGKASNGSDGTALASDLKEPAPRHFPWLSRLSAQLEPAATQKSPFAGAPMVGETLNQSA